MCNTSERTELRETEVTLKESRSRTGYRLLGQKAFIGTGTIPTMGADMLDQSDTCDKT